MNSTIPTLGEAARQFLAVQPAPEREASQQEVYRFVRWYGSEKPCSTLSPPDIANYAEQLSLSDADFARKLDLVKGFLNYIRKQGWTETNLAVHLKARKGKPKTGSAADRAPLKTVQLTAQGYAEIEAELAVLKGKRTAAIDEIRRAAADKDFRENAPLEAAREHRGHIEGRIREIEDILKSVVVVNEKEPARKAGIGDKVVLRDLATGQESCYVLVSPSEVDPARQRISTISPLGKAVAGRGQGEIVELTAPAGKLRYEIKQIER